MSLALDGGGFPTCGDDLVNVPGEECDGTDLARKDCTAFGLVDGALACSGCVFDTSACVTAPFILSTGQTLCDQGAGTLGPCPGSPAGQDASVGAGQAKPEQGYENNCGTGTIGR